MSFFSRVMPSPAHGLCAKPPRSNHYACRLTNNESVKYHRWEEEPPAIYCRFDLALGTLGTTRSAIDQWLWQQPER
jgi:hypothetical protein